MDLNQKDEPIREVDASGRVRYLRAASLPMVSGTLSALVLALCFLLTAVLIPVSAHLPRWVEFELVLAVWWALWVCALTILLYRGQAISDDFPRPSGGLSKNLDLGSPDLGGCTGCAGPEWVGCADTLGAIAVGILIVIAAFVLIEFALPGVAFLIYFLIRGMLARVVNNRKECRRQFAPATAWGIFYATVYTAPLALAVWGIHGVAMRH